jgi:hypothetical protein
VQEDRDGLLNVEGVATEPRQRVRHQDPLGAEPQDGAHGCPEARPVVGRATANPGILLDLGDLDVLVLAPAHDAVPLDLQAEAVLDLRETGDPAVADGLDVVDVGGAHAPPTVEVHPDQQARVHGDSYIMLPLFQAAPRSRVTHLVARRALLPHGDALPGRKPMNIRFVGQW